MAVVVPVNVITESAVPSPPENDSPATPDRLSVPCVAVSVTRTAPLPASTSEIDTRRAPEKTYGVFAATVCAPGTLLTGASSTGATVTFSDCDSVFGSAAPFVVPLSVTVQLNAAGPPEASGAGRNCTP